MKQKNRTAIFRAVLLSMMLSTTACTLISGHHTQKQSKITHNKSKGTVTAGSFVENLSIIRLALDNDSADVDTGNISAIKSYLSQKTHSKRIQQTQLTLVVMDYKMKYNGAVQQVIAPVSNAGSAFSLLQAVMDKLNLVPGTLQNIHLVSAKITPDKSVVVPEDASQMASFLAQEQERILQQSSDLMPQDDINTQMALITFFTQHHYQDAAYLTLDNVKRLLATASQNKTIDEKSLKILSSRLEDLEGTLKLELPYKF